jgi:putative hemolysin
LDPSSYALIKTTLLVLQPIQSGTIVAIGIMVFLLLCSALISGSEIAFFSITPAQKKEMEEEKDSTTKKILTALSRPKTLLATILIANNFVNVAIILLSAIVIHQSFEFSEPWEEALIQIGGVTFLLLLIGEVLPKVYATQNGKKLARIMAAPMLVLMALFSPVSKIMVSMTKIVDKRVKKKSINVSVDDLEHAMNITGDIAANKDEHRLLEGIVKFGNTSVKQIMRPRLDVVAFDCEMKFSELVDEIVKNGFSRVPVYEESLDNIKGILYIKDLLSHLDKGDEFDWKSLLRKAYFVPETKKIDDLLKEFQELKIHMAIAVDEYGGTAGLLTLEDILEEIVGEISDEFDDQELVYTKIDAQNYVFEGKAPLIDVARAMDVDAEEFDTFKGESDTLAGMILEQAGKILKKHEKLTLGKFTFVVEAADKRRIKQVKVTIGEPEENHTNP